MTGRVLKTLFITMGIIVKFVAFVDGMALNTTMQANRFFMFRFGTKIS